LQAFFRRILKKYEQIFIDCNYFGKATSCKFLTDFRNRLRKEKICVKIYPNREISDIVTRFSQITILKVKK